VCKIMVDFFPDAGEMELLPQLFMMAICKFFPCLLNPRESLGSVTSLDRSRAVTGLRKVSPLLNQYFIYYL
jgi:hypothetical protein